MRYLLSITAILALTFTLSGCASQAAAPEKVEMRALLTQGDSFPVDSVEDIEGKVHAIGHKDKKQVVMLFATWCSDSMAALETLRRSPLLQRQDVEILAIAREQDKAHLQVWSKEKGFSLTFAADPKRELYRQLATAGIPRFIEIDSNQRIVQHVLAESPDALEAFLNTL